MQPRSLACPGHAKDFGVKLVSVGAVCARLHKTVNTLNRVAISHCLAIAFGLACFLKPRNKHGLLSALSTLVARVLAEKIVQCFRCSFACIAAPDNIPHTSDSTEP